MEKGLFEAIINYVWRALNRVLKKPTTNRRTDYISCFLHSGLECPLRLPLLVFIAPIFSQEFVEDKKFENRALGHSSTKSINQNIFYHTFTSVQ